MLLSQSAGPYSSLPAGTALDGTRLKVALTLNIRNLNKYFKNVYTLRTG